MRRGSLKRVLGVVAGLGLAVATLPAVAQAPEPLVPGSAAEMRTLTLETNKSEVVQLPRPARDVLVANPAVADVVLRTPETAFVVASGMPGDTLVYFLDAQERPIDQMSLSVVLDIDPVTAALRQALPDADIHVASANRAFILTGTVASVQECEDAEYIAGQFVASAGGGAAAAGGGANASGSPSGGGGGSSGGSAPGGGAVFASSCQAGLAGSGGTSSASSSSSANGGSGGATPPSAAPTPGVINLLQIEKPSQPQVLLRVRITEMQRNIVKELGITPGFPSPIEFKVFGASFSFGEPTEGGAFQLQSGPAATLTGNRNSFTALLSALETNGLVKTLAEPNLTAVSGEAASFLVGGSLAVPQFNGIGSTGAVSATQLSYGVQLSFTPVVISPGYIRLAVTTSVTEPIPNESTTVNGTVIPQFSQRAASTTVELPSGGSLAIAGLLQDQFNNNLSGLPGLSQVPILGTFFSDKSLNDSTVDLVIAVTAYIVKPVDANAIAFPPDGFGPASDFNMYFLGKLNATYAKPAAVPGPPPQPNGPFGFIME